MQTELVYHILKESIHEIEQTLFIKVGEVIADFEYCEAEVSTNEDEKICIDIKSSYFGKKVHVKFDPYDITSNIKCEFSDGYLEMEFAINSKKYEIRSKILSNCCGSGTAKGL